ncbi:MAG: FAD-binding and (Fe-S)-binding domain-containing protein [Phycisphaerales bacterium]
MIRLDVLGTAARDGAGVAERSRARVGEAALARLEARLREVVLGEVWFDRHHRQLYATDASLYQVEALGVVVPASVGDAVRAARACFEAGVAVLPRGGGTSLAGQCTNEAVVIDFSARCTAILEEDVSGRRCVVEPGITVDDLNDRLGGVAGMGLFFAPDPATSRQANVGGCIGNNAAGSRSILYGRTSESLLAVDVLLASGHRVRLARGEASRDPIVRELTRRVLEVVLAIGPEIRERFPRTVRRNAGYALDMVLDQALGGNGNDATALPADVREMAITEEMLDRVNLAHLVCGSEGTLALTLVAELRLHPRPRAKGLAVVGFSSLESAIDSVVAILGTSPSAVELLDDTVIDLARANVECSRYVEVCPSPREGALRAVLYVEYFGESEGEIRERFAALRGVISRSDSSAAIAEHTDAGAMLGAWKLRKAGEPLLHGIPGNRKPITFVEDNAVPVEQLSRFVREFRAIVERHGTRAAFYAHASVGVLHVRPLIDLHEEGDRARMRSIAMEVADLAKSLGGVMSGEHGDGRVRTPLLERFYGERIMRAMREVKAIFDPMGLLNPGNIVEARGVETMTERLRISPHERAVVVPEIETYFDYSAESGFDHAVELCNGAGVCRKKQGGTMCPSYMATLDERHSTRGRGNALRLAITGQSDNGSGAAWDDAATMETLDLCLSCKACKTECPSNVDIARLKAEYTAQRYRVNGVPMAARIMGEARLLGRLASLMPGVANAVNRSALGRAVVNRVLGIHAKRSMPVYERSLASLWGGSRRSETSSKRVGQEGGGSRARVVLFGDCFSMYNEPGIGLATRRVFEAFGYEVVLADAGCCARAKISLGVLEGARAEIEGTAARLVEFARDPAVRAIVVAEPSCLSAIKDDWRALKTGVDRKDLEAIAAKCWMPEDFLDREWAQHPKRARLRLGREGSGATTRVVLHGHCHQKALWGAETSARALRRIEDARVEVLDSGCCGMAGAFGFGEERYELSMRIGELAVLPAARALQAGDVMVMSGTSCRHQVHDGTDGVVRGMHPMEVLAASVVE